MDPTCPRHNAVTVAEEHGVRYCVVCFREARAHADDEHRHAFPLNGCPRPGCLICGQPAPVDDVIERRIAALRASSVDALVKRLHGR